MEDLFANLKKPEFSLGKIEFDDPNLKLTNKESVNIPINEDKAKKNIEAICNIPKEDIIKHRLEFIDASTLKTQEFCEKVWPEPNTKNFHTQLGVHFEEIGEMLEALSARSPFAKMKLDDLLIEIQKFSRYCKEQDNVYFVKEEQRIEFLDGLCDQLVTVVGVGHMAGMDVSGGFAEVNRSNNSKFDENGKPLFDKNLKMIKGPFYFRPVLEPYVNKNTNPK